MIALAQENALVLGLGMTGLSMVRWLKRAGARVRVADSRESPPNVATLRQEFPDVAVDFGPFQAKSFEGVSLLALSPGVAKAEPLVEQSRARGVHLVGDVELFAQAQPELAPAPVLAITGSNGKSTVTALTGEMCKRAGKRAVVAGNIGIPVLDALTEAQSSVPDVFVLELSSFQLETTSNLNAAAATCLNLSEDHLDRYSGMAEYADAKARIFQGDGVQVLNRQDEACARMARPARKVRRFGLDFPASNDDWGLRTQGGHLWLSQGESALMRVDEMRMEGMHNAANALAALALCRSIDLPYEPLLDTLRTFEGLAHRVQKVAEVRGVVFFDDSKGTNVGATVAALSGFTRPTVLIAGGEGKGQDFAPLAEPVRRRARAVVLIGRDAPLIEVALGASGVQLLRATSMQEAVDIALGCAQPGDAVLLSPACASFDMFRNYEHRAQAFVQAVRALEARA